MQMNQFKKKKVIIFTLFMALVVFILSLFVLYCTNHLASNSINVVNDNKADTFNKIMKELDKRQKEDKKKVYLIGVSQCNSEEPYRKAMNDQLISEVKQHEEFKLEIVDGLQDNSKQVSDIEGLINKKCDLIIVSPNESKPLTEIVQKVYNSGIPVILLDRKVDGEAYTQFIGADNFAIGKKAGEWTSHYLGDAGGNVEEITGSIGTSAQVDRHTGFLEGIKNNTRINIISTTSSDWLKDKAIMEMEKALKEFPKIDVVYAQNDVSAEGAYLAAYNAKRTQEMKFIGIDGLATINGGLRSVIDGRISVTYLYPTGGKEAIENAYRLLVKREPIPKNVTLDTLEITSKNAMEVYNEYAKK